MKNWFGFGYVLVLSLLVCMPVVCAAQKIAITFDDLPQNGDLPPGVTRVDIAKSTLAILKKHHVPAVYGFVNARKIEDSQNGADALKLWAATEPVGNHTYSHMDLDTNSAEAFEQVIAEDEPVLELLKPAGNWRWLRYPYLHEGDTLEKRNAVRDYLKQHGYKVAQVTIEWGDYFWNDAYARCATKSDAKSIDWLRSSYLSSASQEIDHYRQMSNMLFGRDINYVLLLHLGSFSSTIVPAALDLLKSKGFKLVTLEEAESDPAYASDPGEGALHGGTLLDQIMRARKLQYPSIAAVPQKQLESMCQ